MYSVHCTMYIVHCTVLCIAYSVRTATVNTFTVIHSLYNIIYIHLPKTKKFGCGGRGDLTLLFKSCEIDKIKVREDLSTISTNVKDNKSSTSRPSDLQKLCLSISHVYF